MQMKKPQTPQILFPKQRGKDGNTDYVLIKTSQDKSRPAFSYIKLVARKLAGVFSILFLRKGKSTREDDSIVDDSIVDTNTTNTPERGFSYNLTGSSSRASTKNRSSSSYGFSSSTKSQYSKFSVSSGSKNEQLGPVIFSFEEISKGTVNFSPANKIGEGGFGTLYKARLKDGSLVAVKRANKNTYHKCLSVEFKNEIFTLSKLEHLNLVRLHGFLEHDGEQIIVMEYVSNGNLREHLDGKRGHGLEMAERLQVAIDVAHAVTYLHTYTDTPIIHRDIKASNILITDKFRAKVADFGFARLAEGDANATHISTQVKGSAGYVDPEYLMTFQLTEKSDVYSFGVLLVELVTGRRPIESKKTRNERITVRWAIQKLKEENVLVVMDPMVRRCPESNIAAQKILELAEECLASSKLSRPYMKQCAEVLWGIRKEFQERTLSSTSTLFPIEDEDSHSLESISD